MLYVTAGTVHTIGGGMVLVETQQSSDITYRLYDYGRPRELQIKEGLAAIKLDTHAGKVVRQDGDDPNLLVRSPFFEVEKMKARLRRLRRRFLRSRHTSWWPSTAPASSRVAGMEPVSFSQGRGRGGARLRAALFRASAVGSRNHAHDRCPLATLQNR